MISLNEFTSVWNEFFFTETPVYTIAIFRIFFGLILLYDALFMLPNIKDYFGPNGMIEYKRYQKRNKGKFFSLFLLFPPTMSSVYIVYSLHIIFIIMTITGLFTTFAVIGVYLTLCSIVNRNSTICNGGDNVARIMAFLLIFASSGNVYSLDFLLFYKDLPQEDYLFASPWAIRLMQIQVSIIYLYTWYWKLKGRTYQDGSAVHYVMLDNTYRRLSLPAFMTKTPMVQINTWMILLIEFFLGTAIWISEFSTPIALLGILFHFTIEFILNVHLFGWFMMAVLLLFIDPVIMNGFWSSIFNLPIT